MHFQSTPLSRGATYFCCPQKATKRFQSTPLSRGATILKGINKVISCFFNPRPSHEGRLMSSSFRTHTEIFNPRPSHEGRLGLPFYISFKIIFNPRPSHEGRPYSSGVRAPLAVFQSTPLSRGATCGINFFTCDAAFSIHAPLTRGDRDRCSHETTGEIFNPRPSHEGRPSSFAAYFSSFIVFNPRPSHEGRRE